MRYINPYLSGGGAPPAPSCFTGITTETFDDGNAICDWDFRVKLTVDSTKVSADLSNYLLMIDLSDLPTAAFSNIAVDDIDIRITESDGITEMPFYISQIDTSAQTGILWTRFNGTLSSTTDTDIYLYFSNSLATAYAVSATYGRNNTFQDYEAFWDFEQDPSATAPQLTDLTGNGNDGTSAGGMTSGDKVTGKVGNAWDFDGTDDYVNATPTDFGGSTRGTIGVWFNLTDLTNVLFSYSVDADSGFVQVKVLSGKLSLFSRPSNAVTTDWIDGDTTLNTSTDYLAHFQSTGAEYLLFLNGAAETFTLKSGTNSGDWYNILTSLTETVIAGDSGGTPNVSGKLPNLYISNSQLSADYISTEYNNQNSPSTFYTVGSIEASNFPSGSFSDSTVINDYTRRIKWEQDTALVSSDLTNFLLYIDTTTLKAQLSAGDIAEMDNAGADIRVTFNGIQVPCYPSGFDLSAGVGGIFVRCTGTFSSTTADEIYIYWGNPAASALAATDTNGRNDTFQDYEAFWDFEQDPSATAPQLTDLTGNGNDGTSAGSMTTGDAVAGKVGNAWDFDGTNDNVNCGTSSSLNVGTSDYSIGLWNKRTTSSFEVIFSKGENDFVTSVPSVIVPYRLAILPSNLGGVLGAIITRSGTTAFASFDGVVNVADGNDHYSTVVFDRDTNGIVYTDGVSGTGVSISAFNVNLDTPQSVFIAKRALPSSPAYYGGGLSALWLKKEIVTFNRHSTEYNNQNSPSTFGTYSTVETN